MRGNVPVFHWRKRNDPDSAITTGKNPAKEIDRETALQTWQNEETNSFQVQETLIFILIDSSRQGFQWYPQNTGMDNLMLQLSFKQSEQLQDTLLTVPISAS